jgi:hypothetical protein
VQPVRSICSPDPIGATAPGMEAVNGGRTNGPQTHSVTATWDNHD